MLEGHPDNASASVLGGLTVSWMPDDSGLDRGAQTVTASIALHADVDVVVLVPETQLATHMARAVLPATVPLAAAAAGAGRAALLVHALTSDPDHLHAATRDWLHQEARRPAYPETMAPRRRPARAGACCRRVRRRSQCPRAHDARRGCQRAGPAGQPGLAAADAGSARARRLCHGAVTTVPAPLAACRVVSWATHHSPRSRRPVHHPHAEAVLPASRCSAPMWFTVGQRQLAPVRLRELFAGPRTRGKDPSCQKPPPVP